ncbi:Nucleoporin Nup188 [Trinorchestia longiramus]|nr:Nucleoporin Nup188 [Trinorchestia longiramus]
MTIVVCGKALWSVVCGTNVLPSNDVVGEELEAAAEHLRDGVHYYSAFSQPDHEQWIASSKLKDNQKTFVLRLAKMLNLCSRQSWELFQVFLQEEYRGSSSELTSVLSSYRSESRLLHQIYAFYLTDPMHLLSCRTLLLAAAAAKREHPYQELFADFLKEVLDPEHSLGASMAKELQSVHDSVVKYRDCQDEAYGASVISSEDSAAKPLQPCALDFVAGNPDLPDDGELQWLAARLALAKHLLASLLVYYAQPNRPREPGTVLALVSLAQGEGVCGGVSAPGCGTAAQAAISSLLKDVDALHSLLLTLLVDADADFRTQRMSEPDWRDKLDAVFMELGSRPGHLPPLLAWCVLQGRLAVSDSNGSSVTSSGGGAPARGVQRYSRMAVRAVDGGVMACLHNFLNNQAIVSDKLLREVCGSVVYSLVCVVAAQLSLDQHAACSVQLRALAISCLAGPLPAHLFWAEEEGAAALLLPDVLAVFPDQPRPLLSLCSALAAASAHSCSKVVELLAELPSITWRVSSDVLASSCREVGGAQLVTHSELELLPGLSLPPHTSGTLVLPLPSASLYHQHNPQQQQQSDDTFLVQWHAPSNVWQLILAAIHALDSQIRSGTTVWEWLVQFVEESLELVCNMLKSDGGLIASLEHIIQQVFAVIKSVSSVAEPRERLVRWLLATAAAVSEHRPELAWRSVDRCGLLPCLPLATSSRDHKLVAAESGVEYYRCGALRKMVCGQEAAAGVYPTLRSFCSMLSAALRARLPTSGSVRGGVVFVVREVVPFLVLQWGYRTAAEKVQVLEAVMQVLHNALEYCNEDHQIAAEVCSELSSQSGGATLRAVLEAGVCLEASLDAPPAQWPHGCHAASLACTAHLALSILHRLVLMHCDDTHASSAQHKHRLRNLLAGHQRRPLSHASLLPPQGPSHLTLTVAQFVHHRLNSSLPYLALRILTKLALELEVPLVACLGSQAEVIKELLLYRLRAAAEDTRVKVSITRLLTAAVANQPGLLRAFLTPPETLMDVLTDLLTAHYSYAAHPSAGAGTRETTSDQLISSIVELVAALWAANHAAAVTALRDCPSFWTVLVTPLASTSLEKENGSVVEQTVRLVALEHFLAARDNKKQLAAGLSEALAEIYSSNWTRLNEHMLGWVSGSKSSSEDVTRLRCWRDLLGVLVASFPASVTDQRARSLCEAAMRSLTCCLANPEDPLLRGAAHLTADILLMLASHRASLCSGEWYWEMCGWVLEALRASLLQTPAPTQVRLLSALLLALRHLKMRPPPGRAEGGHDCCVAANDLSGGVLDALRSVVEQHCSLASAGQAEHFCSNAAVLQVACSAMHTCLLLQPPAAVDRLLSTSHIVSALLHAAAIHMRSSVTSLSALSAAQHASSTAVTQAVSEPDVSSSGGDGCSALVSIIGRLLAMLAARETSAPLLNTEQLSTSVALAATALRSDDVSSGDHRALSEVLQCAVQSVQREGVPGVEGCIAITAVHLGALVQALAAPQLRPELAATAAALTAALAPHRRLWVAFHPHSYWTMVEATAASLHLTTHLVRLKALLGQDGKAVSTTTITSNMDTKPSDGLTTQQTLLLNKLLRVVLWCVRAVRLLGPTLEDLLCSAEPDVGQWLPPLLQPSFRRATAPDLTQPNLATLTVLLDLCTAHLKEKSSKKEGKVIKPETLSSEQLSTEVLSACAEEALLLLLTQSALALVSPETSNREARDIRTWLQDDTNSFFSQWLGKRSSTTSPAQFQTSDQRAGVLDRRFLRVAQHLVGTLCCSPSTS